MTNLQMGKEQREGGLAPSTLRRLWFWSPIAAGALLALALVAAVAVPRWISINEAQKRQGELEQLREQTELLRLQIAKGQKDRQTTLMQQKQLLELVAGSTGQDSTFLAALDLEARRTGVQLQLFEPEAAAGSGAPGAPGAQGKAQAPPKPPANGQKSPAPPQEVLEQAGLEKRVLLVSARGTYPQLLAFLRRVELLELLTEQSELSLSGAGAPAGQAARSTDPQLPPQVPEVELKMQVTLFKKKAPSSEKAPPPRRKAPGAPG